MKKIGEQLQMFSTENMKTRPGQKNFDQWMATENPVFHGTFRSEDFGNAEAAHFGTLGQASYRLDAAKRTLEGGGYQRDRYYDPSASAFDLEEDQVEPFTHTGRVHARRMTEEPLRGRLMDADANAAEAGFLMKQGYEDWEVPSSVSESAGTVMPTWKPGTNWDDPEPEFYTKKSEVGARALEAGRPVKYKNFIESDNPIDAENGIDADTRRTSFIVPRGAQQSWEGDVIMDRGNPDWVKDFARKRIETGQESAVPFPSMTIPRTKYQQLNFHDLYDPGAPEPNAPPFPRELANKQKMATARNNPPPRPWLNSIEFEA